MTAYLENCGWKCTPDAHFGTDNEIHIWRIPVRPVFNGGIKLLSAAEKKRLNGFRNNHSKDTFFSSRIAMRKLFSSYLDMPVDSIQFDTRTHGKPCIHLDNDRFEFNLTHSGSLILLAVSNNVEIGIDIEAVRQVTNWKSISRKVFDQKTCSLLLKSENPADLFVRYWTTFESRQKLFGQGVFGDHPSEAESIKTCLFDPAPGYTAAISFQSSQSLPELQFFEYMNL